MITVPTVGQPDWGPVLNAALTELDSRLEQISADVADFGAAGDGVTDDTAAIQNAINTAGSGGVVYFPPTASGYLLDSGTLNLATTSTILKGAGGDASKLIIGPNFSGTTAVSITAYNCSIIDMWFEGADSTPTANPVADAIQVIGVRRARINRCTFFYINGWAIQLQSTADSSTSNPRGSQISQIYVSECAGGVRFLGDAAQNFQMNCSLTDMQAAFTGVASGGSANLDVIMIEDAWDVLIENAIAWMGDGTGSSLHIKGDVAASFITNFDGLGSEAGPCVLIESDAGGFPQNIQITGGVIQQGTIGMRVTGTARHIRLMTSRIINNQTHGISIESTENPVYLANLLFSLNGQGATGNNYDINWSGTAEGAVSNCYFASPIVSTGVAGVQQTINIASGEEVAFHSVKFAGTGAATTNWFTNLPDAVMVANDRFNFRTRVDFASQIACQPAAAADIALSSNVNSATFDQFRILGDGDMEWGPGSGARDVGVSRGAANRLDVTTSDLRIATAGRGLQVAEGSNAKMGTATLNGTTGVVVSTTAVTATSRIFLTPQAGVTNAGFLSVLTRTAGTSFTIASSNAADARTVAWMIIEPA